MSHNILENLLRQRETGRLNASRREFLRSAGAASVVGAAAPFALNLSILGSAAAQTAGGDYKALVCVFLYGGNDHGNTVLATDTTSWARYNQYRDTSATNGAESIALPAAGAAGGVLPITPVTAQTGRSFALHPSLGPLKTLFDAQRLAVVANVGPLIEPLTKDEYRSNLKRVPPKLFSHNDQQSLWQAYGPEGSQIGWGGRVGDMIASQNRNFTFTSISAAGNAVWSAGNQVLQFQVSGSGAVPIYGAQNPLYGSAAGQQALTKVITATAGSSIIAQEHGRVVRRGMDAYTDLSTSMVGSGSGTNQVPPPSQVTLPSSGATANNPLAQQLQTVARIIAGRAGLGAKRQVFFVSMGGFDSHDNEKNAHGDNMARLAHALQYFDGLMGNLNGSDLRNNVTTFTASDFGRTFTSNGDGTDHGWGSHHFVMGGAVKGQDIYGAFPELGSNGHALDVGSGSLLPTVGVDQYAGTMGRWMGLSGTQLADVFPNLRNFSNQDLGFMR
jgi:uncharacterized protein (DUF1501 family)